MELLQTGQLVKLLLHPRGRSRGHSWVIFLEPIGWHLLELRHTTCVAGNEYARYPSDTTKRQCWLIFEMDCINVVDTFAHDVSTYWLGPKKSLPMKAHFVGNINSCVRWQVVACRVRLVFPNWFCHHG